MNFNLKIGDTIRFVKGDFFFSGRVCNIEVISSDIRFKVNDIKYLFCRDDDYFRIIMMDGKIVPLDEETFKKYEEIILKQWFYPHEFKNSVSYPHTWWFPDSKRYESSLVFRLKKQHKNIKVNYSKRNRNKINQYNFDKQYANIKRIIANDSFVWMINSYNKPEKVFVATYYDIEFNKFYIYGMFRYTQPISVNKIDKVFFLTEQDCLNYIKCGDIDG